MRFWLGVRRWRTLPLCGARRSRAAELGHAPGEAILGGRIPTARRCARCGFQRQPTAHTSSRKRKAYVIFGD